MNGVPCFNGEKFTWDKKTKTATAFASCLGLPVGRLPTNIRIISHKTGNVEAFDLFIAVSPYELVTYTPAWPNQRLTGWKINIFNT